MLRNLGKHNTTIPIQIQTLRGATKATRSANLSAKPTITQSSASATGDIGLSSSDVSEYETSYEEMVHYRLTVADILRILGAIREAAELSHIIIFIDEFSALSTDLQRRV